MKEKINNFFKNYLSLHRLYTVFVVLIMAIPFAMFFVIPSTSSTENKKLAEFPSFKTKEGSFNINYMKDLSAYFEDRFAFRNELVDINSKVKAGIFNTSPEDDVIVGNNGWLYYSATLDDYKGDDLSNERELFSIARNIKLIQEYCENNGSKFVFTIAPNKNSLYPENMPLNLSIKISDDRDAKLLKKHLEAEKINYVDLFDLFENQDETLYLKRDSHWNKKGAVLAYNAILDAAKIEHDNYENVQHSLTNDTIGDLNSMIYPVYPKSEEDYVYSKEYTYSSDAGSKDTIDVTSEEIRTNCESGNGNLVMYRDSFGNSLIDLFSEEFSNSYFSKLEPYNISDIEENNADVLVLEKVERHIQSLYKVPPVMKALKKADFKNLLYTDAYKSKGLNYSDYKEKDTNKDIFTISDNAISEIVSAISTVSSNNVDELISEGCNDIYFSNDEKYSEITGAIDNNIIDEKSRVFVIISKDTDAGIYEAFLLNDNQFAVYLDSDIENIGLVVAVLSEDGKTVKLLSTDYTDEFVNDLQILKDEANDSAKKQKEIIEAEKKAKEEAERLKREEEERLRKEQEEAERKAKEEAKKKAASGTSGSSNGKTIVRKTFYEDCGSDSGYYEIVWSDGSVTYKEVN